MFGSIDMNEERLQYQSPPVEQYESEGLPPGGLNKKKVIIVSVIGLIIIVIGVAIFLFIRSRQSTQNQLNQLQNAVGQLDSAFDNCDNSENTEKCKESAVFDTAIKTGVVEVCDQFEGSIYDSCVWEASYENKNPEGCQLIKDKKILDKCLGQIWSLLAEESSDTSLCQNIPTESRRGTCEGAIRGVTTVQDCIGQEDNAACAVLLITDRAVQTKDRSICNELVDENDRVSCQDIVRSSDLSLPEEKTENFVTVLDTDNDGLTDADEVNIYQTDPFNSDTDGDGFSDGDEVSAGYSPVGEGVLETK